MNKGQSVRNRALLLGAIGLIVFLSAWEAVPRLGLLSPTLMPPPSSLPASFLREYRSGMWGQMVGLSLAHYIIGFAWGAGLGALFGIFTGMYQHLQWLLEWVVRVLRPIPNLAWAPFAIIWFGVDEAAAIFIISVGVFWIVFFAAQGAIHAVDRDLIEVAEAFGFRSGYERFIKVLFPACLPALLVGLRTALGQAWMAVVAAELSGVSGLGSRMMQASSLLATDIVVVYMLTMAVLYGVMDIGFMSVQRYILRWKA
jgi:sulfonate transport system permease protein